MARRRKSGGKGISGSQRPLSVVGYAPIDVSKRYDLEIRENIVRHDNRSLTVEICEAYEYCYEVKHTCNLAVNAVYSSTDGDDQGFTIAPDYNFGTNFSPEFEKIDPDTYAIGLDVIRRQSWIGEYVLGGNKTHRALKQALGLGDSFIEIGLEKEGIGRNDWAVARTMYLPPFEMFRLEDDHGLLTGFEQRAHLDDQDPIQFPAWKICHLRYDQAYLYGQSAWKPAIATGVWAKLKEAVDNLSKACRELGINPNVHQFGPNTNRETREAYIRQNELAKQNSMAPTDLYLLPEMQLKKLSTQNPDLSTLVDVYLEWRYRMLLPGLPIYFWPGAMNGSARELSAQPAFQHARLRNEWCNMVAQVAHQIIDTEIKLKKGEDFWREKGRFYRIIWPKWDVGLEAGAGANDDEDSAAGINDLDYENGNANTELSAKDYRLIAPRSATRNGNGNGRGR